MVARIPFVSRVQRTSGDALMESQRGEHVVELLTGGGHRPAGLKEVKDVPGVGWNEVRCGPGLPTVRDVNHDRVTTAFAVDGMARSMSAARSAARPQHVFGAPPEGPRE